MKRYFAAVLLLIPVLLGGCYKQDLSLCGVDENLVLIFQLRDAGGGQVIADKIDVIDVVLFDKDNRFVEHHRVKKEDFIDRSKVTLTVAPGEYHVVAWGNIGEHSKLEPNGTFATGFLETTSGATGCPLYYGPRTAAKTRGGSRAEPDYSTYYVNVPHGRRVDKQIGMVRAHRTVRVWVKGLERIHPHDGVQPAVQWTNIPYKYDFFLDADPGRKTYQGSAGDQAPTSAVSLKMASFNAPIADFADDMTVRILCGTTGEQLVEPIGIKAFIEKNKIDDLNDFDIMVSITASAEVSVYLPRWEEEEVKPNKH